MKIRQSFWRFLEKGLHRLVNVLLDKCCHCCSRGGLEVLPSVYTYVSLAFHLQELRPQFGQFRIGCGVEDDENRCVTTRLAVGGKIEFFLPSTLSGRGD